MPQQLCEWDATTGYRCCTIPFLSDLWVVRKVHLPVRPPPVLTIIIHLNHNPFLHPSRLSGRHKCIIFAHLRYLRNDIAAADDAAWPTTVAVSVHYHSIKRHTVYSPSRSPHARAFPLSVQSMQLAISFAEHFARFLNITIITLWGAQ